MKEKMPPVAKQIKVGAHLLHYLQLGSGSQLLLAFHGYGEDAGFCSQFEKLLGDEYTMVSIDLPYHGKSIWEGNTVFSPAALAKLVQNLMQLFGVQKISLMGYSMGGRVCLVIAWLMPEIVARITLMAPDGLAVDKYHYLYTRTAFGRWLLRDLLERPGKYFKLLDWLRKRHWLDESRYKFVLHYLATPEAREQLGLVWPAMRLLMAPVAGVRAMIGQFRIPVHLFMGQYDRVIPAGLAHAFSKNLPTVTVHVLEKGHRLLAADTIGAVAASLQQP